MDGSDKEAKDWAKESPTSRGQLSGNDMGMVALDWTGYKTYSPMPPYGYLALGAQPPPYMWGLQHLVPPYGTGRTAPHPYVIYPHGGLYAHPSMPPGNTPCSMEVNSKSPERKEKLPIKRSKGSLGSLIMITGKNNESSKAGLSANGSYPKSGESGSEGFSEGSDANSESNSQMNSGSIQDSMKGEASQNGNPMVNGHQNGGIVNQPMVILPMSAAAAGGKVASVGSRKKMRAQLWLQDERELKRQKRKQSNRESAIRSRLRKQGIYDELAQRAETLKEESASLKTELSRIRSNYEQLLAENAALGRRQNAILERLGEAPGQEEIKQEPSYGNHEDGHTELVQGG